MIDNVVQFGNILYMFLRVLPNYIFDWHFAQGWSALYRDSKEQYSADCLAM